MDNMFRERRPTWSGIGIHITDAKSSKEALEKSGLDWKVYQQDLFSETGLQILGYKANIRDVDSKVLGVVTDKYQVVQNEEAFAFTDELLGKGARYETAGMLQEGKRTWLLAKLPTEYILLGDRISPYMVFSNSHDGSGAIKVALTPIRVICQNTLNLALKKAKRTWSTKHTGDIRCRMEEAKETLFLAEEYMDGWGKEMEQLSKIKLTNDKVEQFIQELIPIAEDATATQEKNTKTLRKDLRNRYHHAPDLSHVANNGYRWVNAVSDFATHAKPLRQTESYQDNLFARTIDGHPLIDKAHQMIRQAV